MCGICGIASPDAKAHSGEVVIMMQRISHRGPDAEGMRSDEGCVLGHRRLSIVDLSEAGNQPMVTSDGKVWLVANGEIYNHIELREELEAAGHVFKSLSDNEVLLHGWRQWKESLFPRINGMFACAIWDSDSHILTLARDRIGIKPLYYSLDGEALRFASEIKALIAEGSETPLSPAGLAQFLTFQNMIGESTLFSGIKSLTPGTILSFKAGNVSTRRFWKARFSATTRSGKNSEVGADSPILEEAADHFKIVLENAVARHLMADVPAATYLSAGIDSSAITFEAARHGNGHCFTGTFTAGSWYDEAKIAEVVARRCGAVHRVLEIKPADFENHIDDLLYALDQPRMGMGAFPQYMLAHEVASSHKVVLTGHGGDELFSGYPIFKVLELHQRLRNAPLQSLTALSRIKPAELPHFVYFWPRESQSRIRRLGLPVLFSIDELKRVLRPEVFNALDFDNIETALGQEVAEGETPYERICLTYLNVYLPGLLTVEDKISMAHSVESRVPLLDNEMMDLALDMPSSVKLAGWQTKAVPRHALQGVLPDALFAQPKRGFPTPLRLWLRDELASWMRERLDPAKSPLACLFSPEGLNQIVSDFESALSRHVRPLDEIAGHRMWMLLAMDAWLRQLKARLGVTVRI